MSHPDGHWDAEEEGATLGRLGKTEDDATRATLNAAIDALRQRMKELSSTSQGIAEGTTSRTHDEQFQNSGKFPPDEDGYQDSDSGGWSHFHQLEGEEPPPFGPPQAFCEAPDCPGPDADELWEDYREPDRSPADLWEGLAGLGVVALVLGCWWLAAEAIAGRNRLRGLMGYSFCGLHPFKSGKP
ncbi:unnamed protein product [Polarella glacialis]|nr:unnamed protein product [Polarella glacialis]